MSCVYFLNKAKKGTTVHTLGIKRFKSIKHLNKTTVWSEAIGLIAPVFSYLGFTVQGVGVPEIESQKKVSSYSVFKSKRL